MTDSAVPPMVAASASFAAGPVPGATLASTGPEKGAMKILRGGSFNTQGRTYRVTYRISAPPGTRSEEYGFRLVRTR